MRCPECATPDVPAEEVPEGARFCGTCGTLLRSRREPHVDTLAPGQPDPRTVLGDDRGGASTFAERVPIAAPRWLATAIALVLVAGLAVIVPGLTGDRSAPGIGALEGERWRTELDARPSVRFTHVRPGDNYSDVTSADEDVYMVGSGTVAAYGTERADRHWQRLLPAPYSPTVAGPVLVVGTSTGIVGLDRDNGRFRWEHVAPGTPRFVTGDARVYVADASSVVALDGESGRRLWWVSAPPGMTPGALRAEGSTLVVTSMEEGTVRGLGGAAGPGPRGPPIPRPLTSPPVTGDGNVYLEAEPGSVVALDLRSGEERWRTAVQPETGTLMTSRDVVIRWTRDGGTVALAAEDGRQRWSQPSRTSVPPVVDEGTVYVPTRVPGRILAIDATSGTPRWTRQRPAATPVAADGTHLYLASQAAVLAWDAADGTERWRVSLARRDRRGDRPTPVVCDDGVYVTTVGGPVVALDRRSGVERWRLDPGDLEDDLPTETSAGAASVALPLGDRVVVASSRAVYAVDADTGAEVATFVSGVEAGAIPVFAGGHVIVNLGPSLIGLDADGLEVRWQYTTPADGARIGAHPVTAPTVHGDLVLVGAGSGTLAALDPTTGDPVWALDLGGAIVSRPVVDGGIVAVRTESGDVRAFDADSGRARWRQPLSPTALTQPAVAEGTVYASDGPELIALDIRTGTERWRTDLGSGELSAPAARRDVAVVGTAEGELVAVSGRAGEVLWRFAVGAPVGTAPAVSDDDLVAVTDDGVVISLR